jgi:hypothetical protein
MMASLAQLRGAAAAADAGATSPAGSPVERCPLLTWIEVAVVGADGSPIPNVAYRLVLPDGSERIGKLDAYGLARVEDVPRGECQIMFPDLDRDAWETA